MGTGAGTEAGVGTADVVDGGQVDGGQVEDAAGPRYASWPLRVVAALADNAILAGVAWLALGSDLTTTLTPAIVSGSGFALGSPLSLSPLTTARLDRLVENPLHLIPVAALLVLLVLQGRTGWTPGKLLVGIRVVSARTGAPAGVWLVLARWVLHLLDAILLIGYLRPLWHERRRTFADSLVGTVVVFGDPVLPRRPRLALHAASVTVVVLGLGYGCAPISSGSTSSLSTGATCEVTGSGPTLTTGTLSLSGLLSTEVERRVFTERVDRAVHGTAQLTWASEPTVRDTEYRVEITARAVDPEGQVVVEVHDIGSGGADVAGAVLHRRQISPDGDVHDVELTMGKRLPVDDLTDLRLTVRLLADGEEVAACVATPDEVAATTAG